MFTFYSQFVGVLDAKATVLLVDRFKRELREYCELRERFLGRFRVIRPVREIRVKIQQLC